MTDHTPSPTTLHPLATTDRVVFLKALVTSPKISVGEFTYYDDPHDPTAFESRNVLYAYGPERLVIGKYCCLATGIRFLMAGGEHVATGPSAYPFTMFGGAWTEATLDIVTGHASRGDTVVGNDVWLGLEATVMPGVSIGSGAIVAAKSVVTRDVEPYAVVGGNPARVIRKRYDDADIDRLLCSAWWDWPNDLVTSNVRTIMAGEPREIERIATEAGHISRPSESGRTHG